MADYKELLRRAIQVLPENNGAARRAVYEKARSALVGQLRAIEPPLSAREITQHRLQLEDCIRQVEQEASEAVISALRRSDEAPSRPAAPVPTAAPKPAEAAPATRPVPEAPPSISFELPQPVPAPAEPEVISSAAAKSGQPVRAQTAPAEPAPAAQRAPAFSPEPASIEDIIAAAEKTAEPATSQPAPIEAAKPAAEVAQPEEPAPEPRAEEDAPPATPRAMPSIIVRAEAARQAPSSPIVFGNRDARGPNAPAPSFEPRRDSVHVAAANSSEPVRQAPRLEPSLRGQAVARQQVADPIAIVEQPQIATALSAVREVEVEERPAEVPADPQGAIDRAIATLDREARGETVPEEEVIPRGIVTPFEPARKDKAGKSKPFLDGGKKAKAAPVEDESDAVAAEPDRGGSAMTIFLLVFVVLLASAGGAGFWAWREGFIDFNTMFAQGQPAVEQADATAAEPAAPAVPTVETAAVPSEAAAPGNTVTTPEVIEPTQELKVEERLTPEEPAQTALADPAAPAASAAPDAEAKTEERLPSTGETTETAAVVPAAPSVDATALAGSQSLLLEASDTGTTGAVPFSGTVEWSKGEDELGQPTIVAKANIPARNLTVEMLIRKNADPSLPASHLMEINFLVNETFMGGGIAGLPGVLLKNEELVQGTPLVGASARVVGNSFLFALSASQSDSTTNTSLLTSRKWLDLAIIYSTGKRAIITLEKDQAAEAMFRDVFNQWSQTASTAQPQQP